MSDRTGRKAGSLSAVIYFERSDGHCVMPQFDAGNPALARMIFEQRFKNHDTERWEWREADTLGDVDRLQSRLIAQDERRRGHELQVHAGLRDHIRQEVSDSLRSRMVSSSTSPFEREAIGYYLNLRDDEKRDKHRQNIEHTQNYMWCLAMDSGTKVEDRMPSQPGEFWRSEAQQKG